MPGCSGQSPQRLASSKFHGGFSGGPSPPSLATGAIEQSGFSEFWAKRQPRRSPPLICAPSAMGGSRGVGFRRTVFARSGAVATTIASSILHVARRCGNSAARTLHGPRPRRSGHSIISFACVPARILFLSGGAPLSSNVVSPFTLSTVYIMAFGMGSSRLQSTEGRLRSFFGTGPVEPPRNLSFPPPLLSLSLFFSCS